MAQIETWLTQDLNEPAKVHFLDGSMFGEDNKGNIIGVNVLKGGSPYPLSGSVQGYCVLATGQSIPVAGTINNNKAYIVLPDTAYSVPGLLNIIIKVSANNTVTTLAAVVTTVVGMGSVTVDPSQATIDAWTAQINATITALQNGSVMYNTSQSITTAQKEQARNNIGANTSVVLISGNNYKMIIP